MILISHMRVGTRQVGWRDGALCFPLHLMLDVVFKVFANRDEKKCKSMQSLQSLMYISSLQCCFFESLRGKKVQRWNKHTFRAWCLISWMLFCKPAGSAALGLDWALIRFQSYWGWRWGGSTTFKIRYVIYHRFQALVGFLLTKAATLTLWA